MTITLPLPSAKLSPNARVSWRARHSLTKAHRQRAKLATLALLPGEERPTFTRYLVTFYFPTARRRDDDNALASCKAYRDGIADALGIDDHSLTLSSHLLTLDRQNPRIVFRLLP